VDRCDVIAHSFGARVAIKLAAEHPRRVRQLVLTGAAGIRPRLSLRRRAQVRVYRLARPLASSAFTPQPLKVRLRSWQERQGSADYRAAHGVMRDTFVRVVNEDLGPYLTRLEAPTLLVWGDGDDATPLSDAQLMERLIPDAGLVVLNGVDHFAYLERLSDFCHIVDTFLKGAEA
jgi:pimeloyl-ACP methyl ester carboxylesterase